MEVKRGFGWRSKVKVQVKQRERKDALPFNSRVRTRTVTRGWLTVQAGKEEGAGQVGAKRGWGYRSRLKSVDPYRFTVELGLGLWLAGG